MDDKTKQIIFEMYESGSSAFDISSKTGYSRTSVYRILNEMSTNFRSSPYESLPHEKIKEMYLSGVSNPDIAKTLGLSKNLTYKSLLENGVEIRPASVSHRTATINELAFSEINENSAYWSGFLMADGCITQRPGRSGVISIGLSGKDEKHLYKFRDFVSASYKICTFTSKCGKYRVSRTSFTSQRMCDDLSRYGVVPRKTNREKVFLMELNRHFWRGMIDGDGCIIISKRGELSLNLLGSDDILKQFLEFINIEIAPCSRPINHYHNIPSITINGLVSAKIVNFLYSDSSIFLDRKMDKAKAFLSIAEKKYGEKYSLVS